MRLLPVRAPALSPPSAPLRLLCRPSWSVWRTASFWQPSATFVSAGEKRRRLVFLYMRSVCCWKMATVRWITFSFSTAEQCGLVTSLAATLRMRSRPYSTSTSDIRPWVRQELLLWWAQNRTWQKSLSSWWNLTERFGTWSDEPKATEPLQPSSQTLGFQAQLFDGRLAACDTRSCTAACPMPSFWSCLGLLLSSQWLTSTLLSPGNNQTPFPLLAQSTSDCQKVSSSDVQQYCCVFRKLRDFAVAKKICKAFIALIIEIVTKRPLATEVNNFHI